MFSVSFEYDFISSFTSDKNVINELGEGITDLFLNVYNYEISIRRREVALDSFF
jgi:hypothetical protein